MMDSAAAAREPGRNATDRARMPAAIPAGWDDLWARPSAEPVPIEWHQLKRLSAEIAQDVPLVNRTDMFGALVGSEQLRASPVHRWFTYKEGFAPSLLSQVLASLGLADAGVRVADV